jgi:hypothetical protein
VRDNAGVDVVPTAARRVAVLAGFAAWAMAVPWIARVVGLRLDVPARLEVVDHVVPGAVVLACCAALLLSGAAALVRLGVIGLASLAGLWITATHVTLVPEAIDGVTAWGPALIHLSAGPPVAVMALWMLLTDES